MSDDSGASSTSTLVVFVTGENDNPVANPDAGGTTENASVTVGVLANDTDVDGDDNPSNFSLDSIDSVVVSGLTIDPGLVSGSISISDNQVQFDPTPTY